MKTLAWFLESRRDVQRSDIKRESKSGAYCEARFTLWATERYIVAASTSLACFTVLTVDSETLVHE